MAHSTFLIFILYTITTQIDSTQFKNVTSNLSKIVISTEDIFPRMPAMNYTKETPVTSEPIAVTFFDSGSLVARTFGGIRRLKLIIPAIMYKLGVVTTMLGVLTFLAIKGVLIGLIVLILQLSTGLSKLHVEKKDHGWEHESNHWENTKPPQNIHVHVHGAAHSGHIPSYYSSAGPHSSNGGGSSFWDRDFTVTPNTYNAYANNKLLNNLNTQNGLDADLLLKLREYKELKALRDLRDSLYRQVV